MAQNTMFKMKKNILVSLFLVMLLFLGGGTLYKIQNKVLAWPMSPTSTVTSTPTPTPTPTPTIWEQCCNCVRSLPPIYLGNCYFYCVGIDVPSLCPVCNLDDDTTWCADACRDCVPLSPPPTPTVSPSPSCTPNASLCGNGKLDPCEQCDPAPPVFPPSPNYNLNCIWTECLSNCTCPARV